MRRAGAIAAALSALLLVPAISQAAPPPGAAKSDNLDYVTRVAGTERVVEGKFDRVGGKEVLVLTGRFGFKTLDVSDPENPKPMDTFLPKDIGSEFGYWQDEDMELDTGRKLIIGSLDPRHDDGDHLELPGPPERDRNRVPERLLRHLVREAGPDMGRSATCRGALRSHVGCSTCRFLWTGAPRGARTRAVSGGRYFPPGGRR